MNVTEEICTPMSVYEWKPNKSYLMFVVKENAGEQFATLNNQVQKVCENIEDVKNALNVLKNKMGENTGTLQQIGEIVSALDQKKQDLITKNKELLNACNQVVEYIAQNKTSKLDEATQIAKTIKSITIYEG